MYYYASNDYIIHCEYATGKGFADLVLIPRKNEWNDADDITPTNLTDAPYKVIKQGLVWNYQMTLKRVWTVISKGARPMVWSLQSRTVVS